MTCRLIYNADMDKVEVLQIAEDQNKTMWHNVPIFNDSDDEGGEAPISSYFFQFG